MDARFADLRKIPKEPARRLMALAGVKFDVMPEAPAAAPVGAVLAELHDRGAHADILRLLAVALPVREAIWWGCMAATDLLAKDAPAPVPLAAARAWVFKPTDENREAARAAVEAAETDDDTALIASAVTMHDGKLAGSGDMAAVDAPLGAAAMMVLTLNAMSLGTAPAERFAVRFELLVDRALDIARGGNGQMEEGEPGPTAQETARATAQPVDLDAEDAARADTS